MIFARAHLRPEMCLCQQKSQLMVHAVYEFREDSLREKKRAKRTSEYHKGMILPWLDRIS